MKRFLIWTTPLLLVAVPALARQSGGDSKASGEAGTPAAQTTISATAVATVAPPAKPKKICRTFEVTGRRIADTVCHTKDQWAEYDKANEEAARHFVEGRAASSGVNTGSGGGMGGVNTAGSVIGVP